jgi:cytochrome c-type biogenesis protein CcmH/NrfG
MRRMAEQDPSDEARWDAAQEGMELLGEGSVDLAIEELERVCLSDPRNEHALFFLGNALFEKESWDRALKAYLTVLELRPDHLGAMVATGHTLRMMGRGEQALRMARQAQARAPQDPDVLYLLGVLCFQRGEQASARQHLQAFLATRPELELALEVEGMLQVLGGEVLPSSDDEESPS